MSADLTERLRSLAQDYHDGRLDLAAYRSLRAPLLDSLVPSVAAAAAVAVTQPRTLGWQDDAVTRPGKPRAPAPSTPAQSVSPPARKSRVVPIAIGVAVVVIAAVAVGVLLSRNSTRDAATNSVVTTNAVQDLLAAFVDRGDWSDGSLTSLNVALMEQGQGNLAVAASEPEFQHFVDELRRRLKEQQALARTPLSADASPIAALAVTVGLDLSSPDAAIHIAALPPPRVPESASIESAPSAQTKLSTSPSPAPNISRIVHAEASPVVTASAPQNTATPANTDVRPSAEATATESAGADTCRAELIGSRRPFCHDMLAAGVAGPSLALIPAGAFEMGSTAAADEQPVHRVTIAAPFAISIYEVSQGEFAEYCAGAGRTCPAQPWSGDDYPVVNISWDDARAYTTWLSSVTHHHYALPTEAQWEYAARAGRTGLFPSGDALSPTDAYYSLLTKQTAAARRSQKFNANAFRLVHTVGNVREWVEDAWSQTFAGAPSDGSATPVSQAALRVARGGSYTDGAAGLRLSLREGLPASTRDTTTGFRIVRELP